VLLAITGSGISLARTAISSLTQRTTSTNLLTRVFAIEFSALLIGWAIGTALGPFLIDGVGASRAYLPIGVASLILTWLGWRYVRPLDARSVIDSTIVDALSEVGFLAAMGSQNLELLARGCRWRDVATGTVLCSEGSYVDDLFVVASGELRATTPEGPSLTLATGSWFEEDALLHTVPRSATLTAVTNARVLVVPRSAFLAAVRGRSGGGAFAGLLSEDELEARVIASLTRSPATAESLEHRLGLESGSLGILLATLCDAGELRLIDGVYQPAFGIRRHSSLDALDRLTADDETPD
jgi:CRP-like cAMP-binding protein